MKNILLFAALFASYNCFTQCPFAVTLNTTGNCLGATLDVSSGKTLSKIEWSAGNTVVNTVTATVTPLTGVTVAGGNGSGWNTNQIGQITGVFVDRNGDVYVPVFTRVLKFPSGSSSATYGIVFAGGVIHGSAADQLASPSSVFVDAMGNLFIFDANNARIQKWAPGATSGFTVAGGNGVGSAANQLGIGGTGLFVDAAGNVYVCDRNNHRIQKWAPGASAGVTVAGGNGQGSAANQLYYPSSLLIDAVGNMYISDYANSRIQKWAPGATSGITVAGGNGRGSAANQFDQPHGIQVDANGNIYVCDMYNNRLQKWTPGAIAGITIAGGNALGSGPGPNNLSWPTGLAMDDDGNIYVADTYGSRIQKYGFQSSINKSYTPQISGTYTATVTNNAGCTVVSNAVVINPVVTPTINITASSTSICSGNDITFSAVAVNGGSTPTYQWQVNGQQVGTNSPAYTSNAFVTGDVVHCLLTSNEVCTTTPTAQSNSIPVTVNTSLTPTVTITASANHICSGDIVTYYYSSNAGCAVANSNSIALTVNPSPEVDLEPEVTIPLGVTIILQPQAKGHINKYVWSPGTGLSDNTIEQPAASPVKTTLYTLTVSTPEGCSATAQIKVNVLSSLRIPNAFTPNGDGRNDIFYVHGGPIESRIKDFSIYNRWGQRIFQVHDVLSDNAAVGWNGNFNGMPAASGSYAYVIVLGLKDGTQQIFKGSIVLVR
jgi:gliding motility-associated-like protein